MKNNNIRVSSAIIGLSVVIGVVLISSGIVFGNNPIVNPPGAGINPTFTGLTVTGNSAVTGNLAVSGSIANPSGDLTLSDDYLTIISNTLIQSLLHVDDGITTDGTIQAFGNITTSNGKIGKYYRYRSPGLIAAPSTNLGIYTSSCPAGITVACSVTPVSNGALLSNYAGLGVSPVTDATGIIGCQPKMYNSHNAQNLQVYVWNVCFDATGSVLGALYSVLGNGSLTP